LSHVTGVSGNATTYALLFSTSGSSETYTLNINGSAVSSFSISNTNTTDAVSKINLISTTTGVSATATASNAVLLFDANGDDITIENTSANTNLDVQAVQNDGATTQGNAISLAETGSTDSTRVIGTLTLSSHESFSVNQSGSANLGYATTGVPSFSKLSDISMSSSITSENALAVIDGALAILGNISGAATAAYNRLEFSLSNVESHLIVLANAEGELTNVDYALESARLARAMVLQEVNTALLAQANAQQGLLIKLLKDAA
jgi:flagellin